MITIVVCVCGRVCTCCSSVLLGSRRVWWDITEIGRFLRSKNSDRFLVSSVPDNVQLPTVGSQRILDILLSILWSKKCYRKLRQFETNVFGLSLLFPTS